VLSLEPAGPGAADLLAVLHAQAFDDPWDAPALAALLAGDGVTALVAGEADAPLGFVMLRSVADEAEILTIAVLPAARRRRVGRALMGEAILMARAAGAGRLFLEVAEDNPPALGLYASLGFVQQGRRPGYYARPHGAVAARLLSLDLDA
jgi:ribosomal protein S18 acetylase RimI-like enzyme